MRIEDRAPMVVGVLRRRSERIAILSRGSVSNCTTRRFAFRAELRTEVRVDPPSVDLTLKVERSVPDSSA